MEVHKTATILLLVIENFGLRTMLSKRYSSFVLSLLLVNHSHSVLRSASSVNIIFYIFVGAGTRRGLFENAKGVTPLSRFFDMSSPPPPTFNLLPFRLLCISNLALKTTRQIVTIFSLKHLPDKKISNCENMTLPSTGPHRWGKL